MIQRPLLQLFTRTSLVVQIFIGLVAGILLALLLPQAVPHVGLLGELFIAALKAVAPVLVWLTGPTTAPEPLAAEPGVRQVGDSKFQ